MDGAIGIHHLGIAVSDLEAAAQQYALLIGATIDHGHDSEALGTRALALRTPEGPMIELVAPYADDTPVGRFIAKRGEGMHHVAKLEMLHFQEEALKTKEREGSH